MEYSKDIILDSRYGEVNVLKNTVKRTSHISKFFKKSNLTKFITIISIMCVMLIAVDIILICNFANMLQSML